jgi:DNA-binding MarR family transcriptional regulator
VLFRLSLGDGMRQIDLAEALDVEPITLCRMIDRLEEAGLVERRRDEVDRRAWNIHLTAKARPLIDELHTLGNQFHLDALDGVSDADRKTVQDVLGRMRANLAGAAAAVRRAS